MLLLAFLPAPISLGAVVSWECDTAPDQAGWQILQIYCAPEQRTEGGWFIQHVELCEGDPPPGGQQASYTRTLDEFIGAGSFFVEFRVACDAERSEIPWGGGASLSGGSLGPVHYHFDMARDMVQFDRDWWAIRRIDVQPGAAHTCRLELYGADLFLFYLDGRLADFGPPEGAYPSSQPFIVWRAKAAWLPSVSRWDYIRYGHIDSTLPGDTNCDQAVNFDDIDGFVTALIDREAYSAAHIGCRWHNADLNGDGTVDFDDIDGFVDCLVAGACE